MTRLLDPAERLLRGSWVHTDGEIANDETTNRILWLVEHHLELVAQSSDGWSELYRDPVDGRLWELTYPDSDLHGGGPPRLSVIDRTEAQNAYQFIDKT